MSYAFVRLGNGSDPHGTPYDYPATNAGIRSALAAGKQWLVLEDSLQLTSQLDLVAYAVQGSTNNLRIQGAGGRTTAIHGYGLTNTVGSPAWRLHAQGVYFTGAQSLDNVMDALFEDCIFQYVSGLSVGGSARVYLGPGPGMSFSCPVTSAERPRGRVYDRTRTTSSYSEAPPATTDTPASNWREAARSRAYSSRETRREAAPSAWTSGARIQFAARPCGTASSVATSSD